MKTWFNLAYELIGGKRKSRPFTPVFEELPESDDPSDTLVIDNNGEVMKHNMNVQIDRSEQSSNIQSKSISLSKNGVYHLHFNAMGSNDVNFINLPANNRSTTVIIVASVEHGATAQVNWRVGGIQLNDEAWRDNDAQYILDNMKRYIFSVTHLGSFMEGGSAFPPISISFIESIIPASP